MEDEVRVFFLSFSGKDNGTIEEQSLRVYPNSDLFSLLLKVRIGKLFFARDCSWFKIIFS